MGVQMNQDLEIQEDQVDLVDQEDQVAQEDQEDQEALKEVKLMLYQVLGVQIKKVN